MESFYIMPVLSKPLSLSRIVLFLIIQFTCVLNLYAEDLPPIKLGATLALTGKLAYMGTAERDGMVLAVEEINQNGGVNGRKLELIVEDNAGEPRLAITGFNKLIKLDQVQVLLSAFTHITQAVKTIASESGLVMLYQSSLRTIALENELFFRDYYDAFDSGTALARELTAQGHSSPVFIGETSDACLDFKCIQ